MQSTVSSATAAGLVLPFDVTQAPVLCVTLSLEFIHLGIIVSVTVLSCFFTVVVFELELF